MAYLTFICIAAAIYIALDARKRGLPLIIGLIAIVGAILLPIVAIPLYFLFRTQIKIIRHRPQAKKQIGPMQICPKCGNESDPGTPSCPNCGNALRLS